MELELTEDQEFFAETTTKFLADKSSPSDLRDLRHDETGFRKDFWRQGAELGWTSLLVSEEDGGGSVSGRGVVDMTLVAHEFGRTAAPGPVISTNVVASALSELGTGEQKSGVLAGLLAGEQIATWAWTEPPPSRFGGPLSVTATAGDGGYVLNGAKMPVEFAMQADHILVSAAGPDGPIQLLVAAGTEGMTVEAAEGIDLTRRYARVSFADAFVAQSAVVGDPSDSRSAIDRQLQLANVIQLAEMVGAMSRAFDITMEWAFDRYSFGRPLASYQELKHRFADMKSWLEAGHAIADAAAAAVQDRSVRAGEYCSSGKAYMGVYGVELMQDCVQMHGGIGVTFDHDMHLYLRRVVCDAVLYGTVTDHRQRLTTILEERGQAGA